jgi:hypothetical protein
MTGALDRRNFFKTAAGTLALLLSDRGLTAAQTPAQDQARPHVNSVARHACAIGFSPANQSATAASYRRRLPIEASAAD